MLTSSKTILFLSDESLNFYKTKGGSVEFVAALDWKEQAFEAMASQIIDKDCNRKPVIILNDMVEQHYRKERLPKVGVMDKSQILKRRLQVAFPSYPVRAALPSKEKGVIGGSQGGTGAPQGDLFLFAAVPSTEALTKTLAAVRLSQASIAGFGLLPVESSDMTAALAKKLGGEEKGKTHWAIFIGQHQSGGLRQIITRNGELALTRMTSMGGQNLDSGSWAREVANEFKSTMSYLARFGYGGDDVLDVMVVSENEATKHLKAMIDVPCRLHLILASEAAQNLGVKLLGQESDRYADGLHAAWAGKKSKLTLLMEARQISAISKPRQAAMAAMILLIAGFGFMGYQIFNSSMSVLGTSSEIAQAEKRLTAVEKEYQAEVLRLEQLGIDVKLIQNSIKVYDRLGLEGMKILPLVQKMGQALGGSMKIDAMKVEGKEKEETNPFQQAYVDPNAPPEPKQYETFIQLSFRPDIPPEAAVNEVNKLKARLEQILPDYEIEIKKQAFDMSTSTVFMGEASTVSDQDIKEADYTAEISIMGRCRMLDALGASRAKGLGVLIALVAALAAAYYLILLPHQEKLEKELRALKGNISARETETARLRDDFAKLDQVKFQYNRVLKYGFFGEQDRVFAQNKINEIQAKSGVLSARYEIQPVEVEENQYVQEAKHKLLRSNMKLTVDAFDDQDVYKFIYYLNYGYPGRVAIRNLDIERVRDVSMPVLQSIGSGQATPLVEARMEMDWYTVVPDTQVDEQGGQQQ